MPQYARAVTVECDGLTRMLGGPLDKLIGHEAFSTGQPPQLATDDVSGLKLPLFVLRIRVHRNNFIAITAKVPRVDWTPDIRALV